MSARQGLAELGRLVKAGQREVHVHGAAGAFGAMLVAELSRLEAAGQGMRPTVVVTPDDASARALARDLSFFLRQPEGADATPRIMHLPAFETSPWDEITPDRRAIVRRMSVLFRLSQGMAGDVLVASTEALCRRVIPRQAFGDLVDVIQAHEELDRDRTISLLSGGGYLRVPVVEDAGTFAIRGGVVDVFVPLYRFPLRIELDGDRVESLRLFDPATQRTLRAIDEAFVHPVRETVLTRGNRVRERILEAADRAEQPSSRTRLILENIERGEDFFGEESLVPAFHERMASVAEYLPADALWIVDRPDEIAAAHDELLATSTEAWQARLEDRKLAFTPEEFYLGSDERRTLLSAARRVELHSLEMAGSTAPAVRFDVREHRELAAELKRARAERHEELLRPLVRRMSQFLDEGVRVLLAVPNATHAERLRALLSGYHVAVSGPAAREEGIEELDFDPLSAGAAAPGAVELVIGPLDRGLELPDDRLAIITEAEIFGEKAARSQPRSRAARGGLRGEDFKNLEPGAFVVHTLHGIGLYRGLVKMRVKDDANVDFLHLEYDGGSLYLPVWRVSELQPYAGAEGAKPRLDKLGGVTWQKTRSKVAAEVRQLADELLQLYAQRRSQPGHSFSLGHQDEVLFREFEATFPFEETPDQQRAIDEVLADMDEARPMDRLVCGDVGYGKTEVAVRAALKAALAGRQVAVLAPTTVLVEQHAQTFRARYQDLPVKVAALSRFSTKVAQTEVLKGLADGSIDVVIGTHRLLSADVRFKQLGLVVIDEEQRFGVAHKERMKQLRTQVDVLTMTATPIPRTLHMALVGMREISVITTPPADRLAVRTLVSRYSDSLVVEAVRRELARGGQVFFVHNRVEDIYEWAERLRSILPEVRLLVGHGQLPPAELEKVMVDFVDGKADLLLCTTIIESGIDIPRANTMLVNQADRFGLAQLYQLRGRIGRSRERAYCYLLVPAEDALTPDAKARLSALQRFTELGAGFQIATHDLEIRGAGDLLGARQSGVIAAVGFEAYTQMLEEAVAALKGEPLVRERDPELSCDLPGYIPEDYCPDVSQRLDFYRRLASAASDEEIHGLAVELNDRYGPPPAEVDVLCAIMRVKALGRRLRCRAIELTESRLSLALDDDTPLEPARVMALVAPPAPMSVKARARAQASPTPAWKLTPDMRLQRGFAEAERPRRLEVARALLQELLAAPVS